MCFLYRVSFSFGLLFFSDQVNRSEPPNLTDSHIVLLKKYVNKNYLSAKRERHEDEALELFFENDEPKLGANNNYNQIEQIKIDSEEIKHAHAPCTYT